MKLEARLDQEELLQKRRQRCKQNFLRQFPHGFRDPHYIENKRKPIWKSHLLWQEALGKSWMEELIQTQQFFEIASRALEIVQATKLLLPFERAALEFAIQTNDGAEIFARGLNKVMHSAKLNPESFDKFTRALLLLPRRQSRAVTWPVQTIFLFIADPGHGLIVKPKILHAAAEQYGYSMALRNAPQWRAYQSALDFADIVKKDLAALQPEDMIDIYFFLKAQS